jgi:uncharacterized protein YoaH (UPF0181 family)
MAWGAHSDYGVHAEEFYDKFSEEMEAAVENAIDSIPSAPPLVRTKPSHLYETGPDAQTWPQVALMLWEDIQPYLQNIEMLVSLGLAVNLVKQRIRDWHNDKNQEIAEQYREDIEAQRSPSVEFLTPGLVVTQGSAIALAATDLVNRHGVSGPIKIDSFPRGFPGYSDAEHPSYSTTYLVRCRTGRRNFLYHFLTDGEVHEHYLLTNSDITMLSLPPESQENGNMHRTAFPGITVKSS